jgi:very-short-patch-repair endonuclease
MRRYGTTPDRRRELRAHQTDAERVLWQLLRSRQLGGFKFRRQHSIGPYILDFYCPSARVAVELDGSQHLERQAYDGRRTEYLASEGIAVVRFANGDVLSNAEAVVERLRRALT